MKITIEFLGLPKLSERVGKKREIDMQGRTVMDLVVQLGRQFGDGVKMTLLDTQGRLNPEIQVLLEDEGFLPRASLAQKPLKDGDTVKFLLLAGGG